MPPASLIRLAPLSFALACLPLLACSGETIEVTDPDAALAGGAGAGGKASAAGAGGSAAGAAGTPGQAGAAGASAPTTCTNLWSKLLQMYPTAGTVAPCPDSPVASSLMNLAGRTIDNNGQSLVPCVEARCDDSYVYVATNTLPHYDFVQTTPNALVEAPQIFRIPRQITPISATAASEPASEVLGCVDARNQFLSSPGTATPREPSHFCQQGGSDKGYLVDTLASGSSLTRKLACLGTVAYLINGVVVAGPNEAAQPDPYGNPIFFFPDQAGQTYGGAGTAALDLCGGHTASTMHYHGVNEACFTRADDGSPALSYATAASRWNFADAIAGACTAESGVVGWSPDGHPIKGPCVCVQRNPDGSCAALRRARSSWSYQGLGSWEQSAGAQPDTQGALSTEGDACTQDSDCCQGTGKCHFRCSHAVFDEASAEGGTTEGKRCVLLDYSWCTHRFVDRSTTDTSGADFVYLDRCNGRQDDDGYAYHATGSFPFLVGCYHDEPTLAPTPSGGPPMMNGGGGMVQLCAPGQKLGCCGDGVCDGPETAKNCAEDCQP